MNNVNIMMRDLKKNHPELIRLIQDKLKGIEYGMNEKLFIRKVHMLDEYLDCDEMNAIINCYKNNSIKHNQINISLNTKMQKRIRACLCFKCFRKQSVFRKKSNFSI